MTDDEGSTSDTLGRNPRVGGSLWGVRLLHRDNRATHLRSLVDARYLANGTLSLEFRNIGGRGDTVESIAIAGLASLSSPQTVDGYSNFIPPNSHEATVRFDLSSSALPSTPSSGFSFNVRLASGLTIPSIIRVA